MIFFLFSVAFAIFRLDDWP